MSPSENSFALRVPEQGEMADEDYAVRVRVYPEGDASVALTDTARVALGRAPRGLSEPLVWRRGPTTGPRYVQTATTRFRREDRLRLEFATRLDGAPQARLVDRTGSPLQVPGGINGPRRYRRRGPALGGGRGDELARDLGTGIHIHLNESVGEVKISKERFGRRPTEVAYECGILGPSCVAAHGVWLSDTEIGLMRETGTHISHNPTSNAKLGTGVARVLDYLQAGINVGLGHDSTEGVNTGDLFQVMKFASLMQRAVRMDANLLQAAQLLTMATRNGSAALGHDTGVLATGKKADLIVIDMDDPGFTPLVRGTPPPGVFPSGLRGPRPGREDRGDRRRARDARSGAAQGRRAGDPATGERGLRADPGPRRRRGCPDGHLIRGGTSAATERLA